MTLSADQIWAQSQNFLATKTNNIASAGITGAGWMRFISRSAR